MLTGVGDASEWRKRITAALTAGPTVLVMDNLVGHLDSAALAAVLTDTVWEDRRLGVSEIVVLPNRALWLATGNGVTLSDELRRRTVPIRLDAGVEEPHLRPRERFRHPDLDAWVTAHRPDLVWALLILVRHWQSAGCPRGQRSLGSFESWAAVTGGILEAVGIAGLLADVDEWSAGADPVTEGWRALVERWAAVYGRQSVRTTDVLRIYAELEDDFLEVGGGSERSQATALGKELTSKRDAVVSGHRLIMGRPSSGANRWRLGTPPQG